MFVELIIIIFTISSIFQIIHISYTNFNEILENTDDIHYVLDENRNTLEKFSGFSFNFIISIIVSLTAYYLYNRDSFLAIFFFFLTYMSVGQIFFYINNHLILDYFVYINKIFNKN